MIVHITRDAGGVHAQGHRVALHLGGEPELKRRVLATISQLDDPPDEIRFQRLGPRASEPPLVALVARDVEQLSRETAPALVAQTAAANSSAPTNPTPVTATSSPRSHKRRS
jgi:hypothetical protein